jgi:hypothetical protein
VSRGAGSSLMVWCLGQALVCNPAHSYSNAAENPAHLNADQTKRAPPTKASHPTIPTNPTKPHQRVYLGAAARSGVAAAAGAAASGDQLASAPVPVFCVCFTLLAPQVSVFTDSSWRKHTLTATYLFGLLDQARHSCPFPLTTAT